MKLRALTVFMVSVSMCSIGLANEVVMDFAPGSPGFPFTAPGGNVNTNLSTYDQTVDGLTLTVEAMGGGGTISANNQPNGAPTIVGLGVAGGGGSAINASETLTFSFDQDVELTEIVLDGQAPPEMGNIQFLTFDFSLQQANIINGTAPAGTVFSGAGAATVDDTVTFTSPVALPSGSDIVIGTNTGGIFVRSITVNFKPQAIPEPSSAALMVIAGMAALSRRRR